MLYTVLLVKVASLHEVPTVAIEFEDDVSHDMNLEAKIKRS